MTDTNAGTARLFRSDDGGYTVAHQRATQAAPSFWYYPTLAEAQAAYPGAVLEGPGGAASFAGSLAQLADDDLPVVAAALEAAGRQGDPATPPALTHADAYLLIRGIAPGAPTRVMRAEFAIRPGDNGGFAVTVYADSPPELGGDGSAVVAVVPFGPGGDAAEAMGALLAAVHAADASRDD